MASHVDALDSQLCPKPSAGISILVVQMGTCGSEWLRDLLRVIQQEHGSNQV